MHAREDPSWTLHIALQIELIKKIERSIRTNSLPSMKSFNDDVSYDKRRTIRDGSLLLPLLVQPTTSDRSDCFGTAVYFLSQERSRDSSRKISFLRSSFRARTRRTSTLRVNFLVPARKLVLVVNNCSLRSGFQPPITCRFYVRGRERGKGETRVPFSYRSSSSQRH